MITMIKIELKRAISSKVLLVALIIGCAITVSHIFQWVLPQTQYLSLAFYKTMHPPDSVFNTWVGGNGYSLQAYVFFLILPILAAIPYADTFFTDKESGFIKNVFVRVDKKYYYIAKYITVFIFGGLVILIPLVINLILTATLMPSLIPQVTSLTYTVGGISMWNSIFYTNPYLYVFMYLALDFIFGGIFATIALSISFFVNSRFIVLVTPFIIVFSFSTLLKLLQLSVFDPFIFLNPVQPHLNITFSSVLIIMIISLLLSAGVFLIKGVRNETF